MSHFVKLRRDTTEANRKRISNADDFALQVIGRLELIEEEQGKRFTSLGERVDALNNHSVHSMTTRRGKQWTKTPMRRTLERARNPNNLGPLGKFME